MSRDDLDHVFKTINDAAVRIYNLNKVIVNLENTVDQLRVSVTHEKNQLTFMSAMEIQVISDFWVHFYSDMADEPRVYTAGETVQVPWDSKCLRFRFEYSSFCYLALREHFAVKGFYIKCEDGNSTFIPVESEDHARELLCSKFNTLGFCS